MLQGRPRSRNLDPRLCIVDTAQALNPEAKIFDPTHATKVEVPRNNDPLLNVKSLPTTVSSSPTTAFSFESVSTRSHGQSSLSTSSIDAAVTRLRQIIGIGEKDTASSSDSDIDSPRSALAEVSDAFTNTIQNENPQPSLSNEDKNHITEEKTASRKRAHVVHGESNSKPKGNNNSSRGRRGRKRPLKKEETCGETGTETDNPQGSQASSPVRKHARKVNASQRKNNFAYGSRYWHMMTMPNWRDKTPQR
ncbi:hypothetical protein Plec18167_006693 [Paecilomyces lecythidis]|uniref:Uncharacterized protein n=1 Tax=Paecilomyces lecythidis TaxID=3004212 RepID=A0ABR3X9G5_9EURO